MAHTDCYTGCDSESETDVPIVGEKQNESVLLILRTAKAINWLLFATKSPLSVFCCLSPASPSLSLLGGSYFSSSIILKTNGTAALRGAAAFRKECRRRRK